MLRRYTSGVWTDVEELKRYSGGSWADCESAKRYADGTWVEVWSSAEKMSATCEKITTANYSGMYSYTPSGTSCSVKVASHIDCTTVNARISMEFPRTHRSSITSIEACLKGDMILSGNSSGNSRALILIGFKDSTSSSSDTAYTQQFTDDEEGAIEMTAVPSSIGYSGYWDTCIINLYVYGMMSGSTAYLPSLTLNVSDLTVILNGSKYRASFE